MSLSNEQFRNLMKGLSAAYPRVSIANTPEGLEMWRRMLSDLSYEQLSLAIQTHITTSKWAPSIAEIRELAINQHPRDWGYGWSLVLNCIRRHGSYGIDDAMQELKNKDDVTYAVVKRLGFKELCFSENLAADRANFRMMYDQVSERAVFEVKVPDRLKEIMDGMTKSITDGGA